MSNVNLQRGTVKINRNYKSGKPQDDLVLDYLNEHGSIDEKQAQRLGVGRNSLTGAISKLRDQGYNIDNDSYKKKVSMFSPNRKTVLRYFLYESS